MFHMEPMKLTSAFRTQNSQHWATPQHIYDDLNKEFNFDYDPCPLYASNDGLFQPWGKSNFINPPYNNIPPWIASAYAESFKGNLSVILLPARTGTAWFHEYANLTSEIRFIRGRIKFISGKHLINAPFDSMLFIFKPKS